MVLKTKNTHNKHKVMAGVFTWTGTISRSLVENYTPERGLASHLMCHFRSSEVHICVVFGFRIKIEQYKTFLVQPSVGCTGVVCPVRKLEDFY